MKKYFYPILFSFASIINTISIAGLIINDKDINEYIKPGQSITSKYENPTDIVLKLKNGRLEIETAILQNPQEVPERFNKLKKCNLNECSSGKSYIARSRTISLEGTYISSNEDIFLVASSNLELFGVILKSKEIFLGCNALDVQDCFIDANAIQIEISSPESMIKIIRLTFNKSSSILNMIEGKVDFSLNEIDGVFLILGLQRIDIVFSDKAFIK